MVSLTERLINNNILEKEIKKKYYEKVTIFTDSINH